MKAVVFHKHGGPEVLLYQDVSDPRPGPGEVLIQVKAASINHIDIFLRRGMPGPLQPPVDNMEGRCTAMELAGAQHAMRRAQVGSPETVRRGIEAFIAETGIDELMVAGQIFDHQARLRSFEIVADIHAALSKDRKAASAA